MGPLARALLDRYNAMLSGVAAASFEATILKEHARVIADLCREADRFEQDGHDELAAKLRERAEALAMPSTPMLTDVPRRRGRPPKALSLEEADNGRNI
jgi:hypothetical protein